MADTSVSDCPPKILRVNYKGKVIQYNEESFLGKGAFGSVYKGWKSDGTVIAVKIIPSHVLNQNYTKVRENLEREVGIMKALKNCNNVIQIFIAGQMETGSIIIAMEKCDGDLEKMLQKKALSKEKSLSQKEVIDFLYQLGEGTKELRRLNIVHRDIKPENILVKYDNQKTIYKLADFGYARYFDPNKTMMSKTVAGTPYYMAPEGLLLHLSQEFPEKYKTPHEIYYTDKVDIWSIGAVIYRVLVGQVPFPAQTKGTLYDWLENKQDNLAVLLDKQSQPMFIKELPKAVQKKLTNTFCKAITDLLMGMLNFDEKERFSFPIFFKKIEDIIESKVELVNLLHGTSFKIIQDSSLTGHTLLSSASLKWNIPVKDMIIFSTMYPEFIGPHNTISEKDGFKCKISEEDFQSLVEKSGGWEGHAKLYVLSLEYIRAQDDIDPDYSCLEPLKTALDQETIENLVVNLRFGDEIVYMIKCLKEQLHNQYKSVNILYQFVINETSMSSSYNTLKKKVQQALAQVSLIVKVVENDLEWCGEREETSLSEMLKELLKKEELLKELEKEIEVKTLPRPEVPFSWMNCQEKITDAKEVTKELETLEGGIADNAQKIYQYCRDELIADKPRQTRLKLCAYRDILESTGALSSKEAVVKDVMDLLSQVQLARKQVYESSLHSPSSYMEDSGTGDVFASSHSIAQTDSLVKIAYPEDYRAGDIVLMTPVNPLSSGALPCILHLDWKTPYMLMNFKCFQPMGIKPGKLPQLLFAKLRENPKKLKFKDNPQLARDLGESPDGIFYRATVDPVSIRFSDQHLSLLGRNDQHQSLKSKK